MRKVIFTLFILLALMGGLWIGVQNAGNPRTYTPDEINRKFSSGVVLIKNDTYYTIDFDNQFKLYIKGFDNQGEPVGLTTQFKEVQPTTSFGTGFMVSDDGKIATNSHVANPVIESETLRSKLHILFNQLAQSTYEQIGTLNYELNYMSRMLSYMSGYEPNFAEAMQHFRQRQDWLRQHQQFFKLLQQAGSANYRLTSHSSLSVAFSKTFITKNTDFAPCIQLKDDRKHDLAIIQLKDKRTPESCHVFKVSKEETTTSSDLINTLHHILGTDSTLGETGSTDQVDIGKTLFVIGYNLGPNLALTQSGILPQVTKGEVSQNTDNMKIMYTVPTLHGSSGAPVIDEQGRLVAVNFAGISSTQSFNYGVRIIHLRRLMHIE